MRSLLQACRRLLARLLGGGRRKYSFQAMPPSRLTAVPGDATPMGDAGPYLRLEGGGDFGCRHDATVSA